MTVYNWYVGKGKQNIETDNRSSGEVQRMMAKICDQKTIDCQSSICGRKTKRSFSITFLDERHFYFCCFFLFYLLEGSTVEGRNKSQSEEKQFLWSGKKRGGKGHCFLFVLLGLQWYSQHIRGKETEKVRLRRESDGKRVSSHRWSDRVR